MILKPHLILLLISCALTAFLLALNRILVKKEFVEELKRRMIEIREGLAKAQREGNMEAANKLLDEMLKANAEYMKQNFKYVIVSMIVLLFTLPFLSGSFSGLAVEIPFSLPFIGSKLNWIGWYILVSFAVGWVIRRLLEG